MRIFNTAVFILILLFFAVSMTNSKGERSKWFIENAYDSVVNPLSFVITHFIYFGPAVVLLFLFGKSYINKLKNQDTGLVIFIGFFMFAMVSRNSENYISVWPFFIFILIHTLEKKNISWAFVYTFVGISFLTSRFWLRFNIFSEGHSESYLKFPYQRFFMNKGEFLSTDMYKYSFGIFIVLLLLFYFIYKSNSGKMKATSNESNIVNEFLG